ncbi:MAG: adenosylcobinamide amidohydrolase [Roseovarius sp.]|nr:adenosylcobinamide amidohydrolase [Roseovarius sp.]
MSALTLDRPWLDFDLGAPMQVLSWAPNRAGLVTARHILWREVRNADLPPELDVTEWFSAELATRGASQAVAFLTSRDVTRHHDCTVQVGDVTARAVATVGLSNAERIGHRVDRSGHDWGTINIAVRLGTGLTHAAMLEAISIAAQARTTAVIEAGHHLPTGVATGTGTDCIAVAAPAGAAIHAGLHTQIGEAVGRAAYMAVSAGTSEWMATEKRSMK